jgi:hypothetical protein
MHHYYKLGIHCISFTTCQRTLCMPHHSPACHFACRVGPPLRERLHAPQHSFWFWPRPTAATKSSWLLFPSTSLPSSDSHAIAPSYPWDFIIQTFRLTHRCPRRRGMPLEQLHPFQDEEMPSKKGCDICRMKEWIKGEKQRKSWAWMRWVGRT